MMAKIFRRYERMRKVRSLLGWEQPKKKDYKNETFEKI